MIDQLQGMSGILETNFSQLYTMINEIKDGINKILEEQQVKNTWL
jgi:flagellar basal body-associated protein FliL